jgi:hypothetical protein
MPISRDRRVTTEEPRPAVERLPLPVKGTTFELKRRIETFSGFIQPGPITIADAAYAYGNEIIVNLERAGRVIACGVTWPIVGNDPSPVGQAPACLPVSPVNQGSLF